MRRVAELGSLGDITRFMFTKSPGLIAALLSGVCIALITVDVMKDISHGASLTGVRMSHGYLIAFAIIIAGGLIADAIQRGKD